MKFEPFEGLTYLIPGFEPQIRFEFVERFHIEYPCLVENISGKMQNIFFIISILFMGRSVKASRPTVTKYEPVYMPEADFVVTETISNVKSELRCMTKAQGQDHVLFTYENQECRLGNATTMANQGTKDDSGMIKFYAKEDPDLRVMLMLGADPTSTDTPPWDALLPNMEQCQPASIPLPRLSFEPAFGYFNGKLYDCFGSSNDLSWPVDIKDCVYLDLDDLESGWRTLPNSHFGPGSRLGRMDFYHEDPDKAAIIVYGSRIGQSHLIKYDLKAQTGWETLHIFTTTEFHNAATVVSGHLVFLIGAIRAIPTPVVAIANVWRFDLNRPEKGMEAIEDIPGAAMHQGCIVATLQPPRGKGLLCGGGYEQPQDLSFLPLSDGGNGSWEELTPFATWCQQCWLYATGRGGYIAYDVAWDESQVNLFDEATLAFVHKVDRPTLDRRLGNPAYIPAKYVWKDCWDDLQK